MLGGGRGAGGGGDRIKHSRSLKTTSENRYAFEDLEEEDGENDYEKKEEDIVTPYTICNKTNVQMLIKRLNNPGENENFIEKKIHKKS